MVADREGRRAENVLDTQDLSLVGKGGPSTEVRDFLLEMQKEDAELHTVYAADKAARANRLLEVSALWVEKTAQKRKGGVDAAFVRGTVSAGKVLRKEEAHRRRCGCQRKAGRAG